MVRAIAATFSYDNAVLAPVLSKLFGTPAEPIQSTITALKPGAGNPTSLGVYRISGKVSIQGEVQGFSVVVKHLADGKPLLDASDQTHWNFYKREIVFFESELADRIPKSLGYPKYLGSSLLPDQTWLFWNEDLGDLSKTTWTWSLCLKAAQIAAELNSIQVDESIPWLNRKQVQWWIDYNRENFVDLSDEILRLAGHTAEYQSYGPFLSRAQEIYNRLKSKRQVFVHGDFNLNNLVPSADQSHPIIGLDWQLCGLAAVGTDIASIFNTAFELGVIEASSAQFEEICRTYLQRYNELNELPVSLDEVRFNAAAMGYIIMMFMGYWWAQPDSKKSAEENEAALARVIQGTWKSTLFTYSKVLAELS